jgi:hypothetical protein
LTADRRAQQKENFSTTAVGDKTFGGEEKCTKDTKNSINEQPKALGAIEPTAVAEDAEPKIALELKPIEKALKP